MRVAPDRTVSASSSTPLILLDAEEEAVEHASVDAGDSVSQVRRMASATSSSGLPSHFSGIDWGSRPAVRGASGDELVTDIACVISLQKLTINSRDTQENLTMKGKLEIYWTDHRLAGFPQGAKIPQDIWRPEIACCNGFTVAGLEDGTHVPDFDMRPNARAEGLLKWVGDMVLTGDGVSLSDDFDRLRAFSFDGVRVDLSAMLFGNRQRENYEQVRFVFARPNLPNRIGDGFSGNCQHVNLYLGQNVYCGDYKLEALSYGAIFNAQVNAQGLAFSLHFQRTPGFYVLKGILPLYATICFGGMTYFIESTELAGRLAVLTALFLTFGLWRVCFPPVLSRPARRRLLVEVLRRGGVLVAVTGYPRGGAPGPVSLSSGYG